MSVRLIIVNKIIDSFFKSRTSQKIKSYIIEESSKQNIETSTHPEQPPSKITRVESEQVNTFSLERDSGLRKQTKTNLNLTGRNSYFTLSFIAKFLVFNYIYLNSQSRNFESVPAVVHNTTVLYTYGVYYSSLIRLLNGDLDDADFISN